MATRWDVLGSCGTRNCTCPPIFVAVWVWADSLRFLDNGLARLVALGVLADAAKLLQVWCASARWDWWSKASEGVSLSRATKQPGVAH